MSHPYHLPVGNATEQEMKARVSERSERHAENSLLKAEREELMRNEGNEKFKHGDYEGARHFYTLAVETFGPKPVLMANLAAAYLKLELYDLCNWAATKALQFDPRMIKARYRRAFARKEMNELKAAMTDLEMIISEDPECVEAITLLESVRSSWEAGEGNEDGDTTDDAWPAIGDEPWDLLSDSDSSECNHIGNGIPCRFYNHDGCSKGINCHFSHAPDSKSVRDELGRNVCIFFLAGTCKFGPSRCVYSHTKEYLPTRGWWNNPEQVAAARAVTDILDQHGLADRLLDEAVRSNPAARGVVASLSRGAVREQLKADEEKVAKRKDKGSAKVTESAQNSNHFILLLSFEVEEYFQTMYSHLLDALKAKVKIVQALTMDQAMPHFSSPDLVGVLITDPGIIKRKNAPVVKKVVEYVRNGGSVVVGCMFSTFVRGDKMNEWFSTAWGLNWKGGSYHRTTFKCNPDNEIVQKNPSLAPSYSMKALHVGGIAPESAVYIATQESRTQSLVFQPAPVADLSESPAVTARIGKGFFSYIGDVNAEEESTKTILAMLGLLDAPNSVPPRSSTAASADQPAAAPALKKGGAKGKGKGKNVGPVDKGKGKDADAAAGPSGTKTQTKAAPIAQPSGKPFVLLLSLKDHDMFANIHADQLNALQAKIEVQKATSVSQALNFLSSPSLSAVFVTDEGISLPSSSQVLTKLVQYVKAGGVLAIGGLFSSFIALDKFEAFFASFGVEWKRGTYQRNRFVLDPYNSTVKKNLSLPPHYSMKAVSVQFIPRDVAMYVYDDEDSDEDMLQPGEFFLTSVRREFESPVVRTRVGKGYLGYLGDVNAEKESTKVILALLNLLDPVTGPPAPTSRKFVMVLSFKDVQEIKNRYKDFFRRLKNEVEVIHGLSNERNIDLLKSPDLVGVLVTATNIIEEENAYLLGQIVEYAKGGGTVVFAGFFGGDITVYELRPFFKDEWDLSWEMGAVVNTTVSANRSNELIMNNTSLASSFTMSGLYIKGLKPEMAVYNATDQFAVPALRDGSVQAPVVYARVGQGHLGFVGSTSLDGEERDVVLAMLGVLKV